MGRQEPAMQTVRGRTLRLREWQANALRKKEVWVKQKIILMHPSDAAGSESDSWVLIQVTITGLWDQALCWAPGLHAHWRGSLLLSLCPHPNQSINLLKIDPFGWSIIRERIREEVRQIHRDRSYWS